MIETAVALVVATSAGLFALFAAQRAREMLRRELEERRLLRDYLTEWHFDQSEVDAFVQHAPGIAKYVQLVQEQIADRIASRPGGEIDALKEELKHELASFNERMSKMEERFPPEAELDKIASINDALLSERIDQLAKRMVGLETRILTRWDVALVVSSIIAGIGFVVVATVAILRLAGVDVF